MMKDWGGRMFPSKAPVLGTPCCELGLHCCRLHLDPSARFFALQRNEITLLLAQWCGGDYLHHFCLRMLLRHLPRPGCTEALSGGGAARSVSAGLRLLPRPGGTSPRPAPLRRPAPPPAPPLAAVTYWGLAAFLSPRPGGRGGFPARRSPVTLRGCGSGPGRAS